MNRVSRLSFLYLCLFVSFCSISIGQEVMDGEAVVENLSVDSLSRPNVYYPMLESFEYHKLVSDDIVFLGNSITFWADWPTLLNSDKIKNRGIPGDNTFGVKERLYEITQSNPSKVFILIGINDLAAKVPDKVIVRNCREIVRRIKKETPKTTIYVQTLLPTNEDFGKAQNHYGKGEQIRYINEQLKMIGKEEGITVIDLYAHFVDEKGRLKGEYTWDGLHLTIAGYLHWVSLLIEGAYLKGL